MCQSGSTQPTNNIRWSIDNDIQRIICHHIVLCNELAWSICCSYYLPYNTSNILLLLSSLRYWCILADTQLYADFIHAGFQAKLLREGNSKMKIFPASVDAWRRKLRKIDTMSTTSTSLHLFTSLHTSIHLYLRISKSSYHISTPPHLYTSPHLSPHLSTPPLLHTSGSVGT